MYGAIVAKNTDNVYIEIPARPTTVQEQTDQRKLVWSLCAMIGISSCTLVVLIVIFFTTVK